MSEAWVGREGFYNLGLLGSKAASSPHAQPLGPNRAEEQGWLLGTCLRTRRGPQQTVSFPVSHASGGDDARPCLVRHSLK